MTNTPMITFRDGPTGGRAGLIDGPDVWEVAMWVDELSGEPDPVAALISDSILTRPKIDAALGYRTAYPEEIDARIELHRQETAASSTSWSYFCTRCTRRLWPMHCIPVVSTPSCLASWGCGTI